MPARLGARGALHPSLYEISFQLDYGHRGVEVPQAMVLQSIKNADDWQHLPPIGDMRADTPLLSVFARTIGAGAPESNHTIIAVGVRSGNEINVINSYYVFHQDVDVSHASTSVEVLSAFAQTFGFEMRWQGESLGRFVAYTRRLAHNIMFDLQPEIVGGKSGDEVLTSMMFRVDERGGVLALDIALAMVINLGTYRDCLQRHGIKVRPHSAASGNR